MREKFLYSFKERVVPLLPDTAAGLRSGWRVGRFRRARARTSRRGMSRVLIAQA